MTARTHTPLLHRAGYGLLAGLAGALGTDLLDLAAQAQGVPRYPTLSAQIVAKAARTPGASRRRQHRAQRAGAEALGLQHPHSASPDSADQEHLARVGRVAHYGWCGLWGVARAVLPAQLTSFSAATVHGITFATADHVLLASLNLGTPVWGHHDRSTDSALQAGQLLTYTVVTNSTYHLIAPNR